MTASMRSTTDTASEETNAPLRRGLKLPPAAPGGVIQTHEETNAPLRRGLKLPPPPHPLTGVGEETNAPLRRGLKHSFAAPPFGGAAVRKPMPRYEGD